MQWIQWPNHLLSVISDSRREVWKIIQLLICWLLIGNIPMEKKIVYGKNWTLSSLGKRGTKPLYIHSDILLETLKCHHKGWIWFTCTAKAPLLGSCDFGMKISASPAHFSGYSLHKGCICWGFLSKCYFFNKCVSI